MSKEKSNKFLKELTSNSDLAEQFKTFATNLSNLSDDEKKEKLTEFITKRGYDFDANDLKDHILSEYVDNVSEDEFANVAGGGMAKEKASQYCSEAASDCADMLFEWLF